MRKYANNMCKHIDFSTYSKTYILSIKHHTIKFNTKLIKFNINFKYIKQLFNIENQKNKPNNYSPPHVATTTFSPSTSNATKDESPPILN